MKEYYIHEYVTDLLVWNFRTENEAITRGIEAGLQLKIKYFHTNQPKLFSKFK